MISAGGKYWPEAGTGRGKAASASRAAPRTPFAVTDAFLVCDWLAAQRDRAGRQPRGGNPIWSRPNPFAYSRRLVALRAHTGVDDFCASPERTVEPSPTILGAKKAEFPSAARKCGGRTVG